MKIVFLCGSLEPGKDGVGDYTRRLAGELIRQGHQVAAVSLNDRYIASIFIGAQYSEEVNIPVLRIPSTYSDKDRVSGVKSWIDDINPDWLSLQYVPFSYNLKGLPFKLEKQVKDIGGTRKWHIMFHEVWMGHAHKFHEKSYWFGKVQKVLVIKLFRNLNCKLVTTQSPYYQYLLNRAGIESKTLPLFGNLPIAKPDEEFVWRKIRSQLRPKFDDNPLAKQFTRTAVIFGNTPPNWEYNKLLSCWSKALNESNHKGLLLLVGRNHFSVDNFLRYIEKECPSIIPVTIGELDTVGLSQILQECDFGISPFPLAVIQKSGTTAAMKEHGLHIIVTRIGRALNVKGSLNFDSFIHYIDDVDYDFFNAIMKAKAESKLPYIAKQLYNLYESTN